MQILLYKIKFILMNFLRILMLSLSKIYTNKQVLPYLKYQISGENLLRIFGYIIGICELRILLICISFTELIMKQIFLVIIVLISHVKSGSILKLFSYKYISCHFYFRVCVYITLCINLIRFLKLKHFIKFQVFFLWNFR